MVRLFALACHYILEAHLAVGQSVLSVANVLRTKRAIIKSVTIHVLEHVHQMQIAELTITVRFAIAKKVSREIHSQDVYQYLVGYLL